MASNGHEMAISGYERAFPMDLHRGTLGPPPPQCGAPADEPRTSFRSSLPTTQGCLKPMKTTQKNMKSHLKSVKNPVKITEYRHLRPCVACRQLHMSLGPPISMAVSHHLEPLALLPTAVVPQPVLVHIGAAPSTCRMRLMKQK